MSTSLSFKTSHDLWICQNKIKNDKEYANQNQNNHDQIMAKIWVFLVLAAMVVKLAH